MFSPDLMTIVAKQHMKELADAAAKHRLAVDLRKSRRQRWPALDRKVKRQAGDLDREDQKVRDESKSVEPVGAGRLG